MRPFYFSLLALLLFTFSAEAQTKPVLGGLLSNINTSPDFKKDAAFSKEHDVENDDVLVNGRAYASIVGERFSYLVTGDKDQAALGNFAAINPLTSTATVAFGGIAYGKKSKAGRIGYISGSATGGSDQNIITLFSDNKLNSSFEGRVTFSFLAPLFGTKFYFEKEEWEKLTTARRAAVHAMEYRRTKYQLAHRLNNVERERIKKLTVPTEPDPAEADAAAAEKLKKVAEYRKQLAAFDVARRKIVEDSAHFDNLASFTKTQDDTIFSVDKKANWSSIKLGWFDVFGSGKLQKVNLYNGAAPFFAQRLIESRQGYFKVGAAYNISWSSDDYSPFFNGIYRFEVAYSKNNNTGDLIPFDVSTSQKTDSSNFSRTSTKKVSSYEKKEFAINEYLDYRIDVLKEITRNHRAYLRLVYNYSRPINQTVAEGATAIPNTHNLTLGYLLAFNNKAKTTSILNIQPYIKFKDFTNEYQKDLSLLRRSEIGIQTVFPLGLTTPKD